VDTAEFEAAGLYDPDAPDAPDRLALLRHLAAQGISVDAMRSAAAVGSLHAAASDVSVRRVSKRSDR